jgi:hypothetical protein
LSQQSNRERRDARRAPRAKRRHDQPRQGCGRVGIGDVTADRGIAGLQGAGRGVAAVTLLGNSDADDADGGIGEPRDGAAEVLGRHDHAGERRHHREALARGVALAQRIEPVLRLERVAGVWVTEADPERAPAEIVGQQRLRVERLMGAMEGADADMDVTRRELPRIDRRAPHRRWKPRERVAGETHGLRP